MVATEARSKKNSCGESSMYPTNMCHRCSKDMTGIPMSTLDDPFASCSGAFLGIKVLDLFVLPLPAAERQESKTMSGYDRCIQQHLATSCGPLRHS